MYDMAKQQGSISADEWCGAFEDDIRKLESSETEHFRDLSVESSSRAQVQVLLIDIDRIMQRTFKAVVKTSSSSSSSSPSSSYSSSFSISPSSAAPRDGGGGGLGGDGRARRGGYGGGRISPHRSTLA
jgi:hypothetical protein